MMRYISLQSELFDTGLELAKFTDIGVGAISSFTGIVRAEHDIKALAIEHHPIMSAAALNDLADRCETKYDLRGIIIIHRYGVLDVGQPIVLVAASSPHRKDAMQATAYAMDRLKTDVPFWKKEIRQDGSEHWIEQKPSDVAASQYWHS